MSDTPKRGRPVRYIPTGEFFRTIYDACEAKKVSYNAVWESCNGRRQTKRWEYAGPPVKLGKAAMWSPEEDEVLRAHTGELARDFVHLLPGRTIQSIQQRVRYLAKKRVQLEKYEDARRRPLTEETAYQCRIEYADKRAIGYTPEQALAWVAEANDRDIEIVRDVLFNPAYDKQVGACRRKYEDPDYVEAPRKIYTRSDYALAGESLGALHEELDKQTEKKTRKKGTRGNPTPVIGTNIVTGEVVFFPSLAATAIAGFNPECVSKCLNGKAKAHQDHTWARAKDHQGGERE